MPRVSINRKWYKLNDLKGWIVAQMHLHHMTQAEVGQALGISQSFSYGDLLTLCELFEASEEEKQRLLTM